MLQLFKSVILFIIAVFYTSYSFAQYIAIVDGGSSSSRLHLYSVMNNKIVDLTPAGTKAVKPALSNLSTDTASINQYAANLIAPLSNIVDNGHTIQPSEINFYLYATAGMRLVPPTQAATVYAGLTKALTAAGFATVDVETITGKMEGVYDWLALNYLKNTLSSSSDHTFGVLDMGGASTEVVYATTQPVPSADAVSVTINGHAFQLYSHSYLGLGQDVARSQYSDDANCFPVNYPLPDGLKGKGQYDQCVQDIGPLVSAVHHVTLPVTPKANQFYAESGFYYTATSPAFGFNDHFVLSDFFAKGNTLCGTDWSTLKTTYPTDNYLYGYCFNSAFYNVLLTQGYHFENGDSLNIVDRIDGTDVDWTLGVALYLQH